MPADERLARIERRVDAIWHALLVVGVLLGAAVLFGLVLPLFIDALGQDSGDRLDEIEACIQNQAYC